MAFDKPVIKHLMDKAKTALSEKDFGTYWEAVYGIAASAGGADGDEQEQDDVIYDINRKLGGPGS